MSQPARSEYATDVIIYSGPRNEESIVVQLVTTRACYLLAEYSPDYDGIIVIGGPAIERDERADLLFAQMDDLGLRSRVC